jgi:hypothetical protein
VASVKWVVVTDDALPPAACAAVTRAEATAHLRRSGAAISDLVAGLSAADLALANGQIRLLAQIAARHADNHRADIETALAQSGR